MKTGREKPTVEKYSPFSHLSEALSKENTVILDTGHQELVGVSIKIQDGQILDDNTLEHPRV